MGLFDKLFKKEEEVVLPALENVADEDIGLRTLFNGGLPIRIVGIVRQNEDAVSGMMSSGAVGYTHRLVEYVVGEAEKKELELRAKKRNSRLFLFFGSIFEIIETLAVIL